MPRGVLSISRWLSLTNDVFLRREALEDAPCGILAWNQELRVVYANRMLARMTRREASTFFNLSIIELRANMGIPEYDPVSVLKGKITSPKTFLLTQEDGTSLPVECTTRPIYDLTGNITGAVSFFLDLRDRILTQHLRSAVDNIPEGILVVGGTHKRVILANSTAADLLGLPPEDLPDKTLAELLPLVPPNAENCTLDVSGPSGNQLQLHFSELSSPTGPTDRTVVLLHDLTSNTGSSSNSLMVLARQTVHEIRNPLTAVYGFLRLLSKQSNSTQEKDRLQLILMELERVNTLLQEFLDLSPNIPEQVPPCHPYPVAEEVLALYRPAAAERNINLTNSMPPDSPPVKIDPRHLKQLLHNLVRNALDALDGKGEVRICSTNTARSGFLRITVEDTGPGIAPEDLQQIFQPFFTTKEHGSGLGLPLCRQMLGQYGGALDVTSTLGLGTTFLLDLPLHE